MNIGVISCLAMSAVFLLLALLFLFMKEKGAALVSGFNTLTKAEQEQYDKRKLSIAQRNMLLFWVVIFFFGALLSWLVTPYLAFAAFAVWLVLFFREVHSDPDKAFAKYKKGNAFTDEIPKNKRS